MIQIILMIVWLVYFVKLLTLGGQSAAKLGLEALAFEEWKQLRRLEYYWMIAAGWGSFAFSLVLGLAAGFIVGVVFPDINQSSEVALTYGLALISLVVMLLGYSKSRQFGKQAKALVDRSAVQPTIII